MQRIRHRTPFGLYTHMNTHIWISKLLTAIVSVVQASTLRDRYYRLEQRCEILATAIEDIERINANSANPNALIAGIVNNCRVDKES